MKKLTKARKLKVTSFPYREFASHGGITYCEDEDMTWTKWEYDAYGSLISIEHSNGEWHKWQYDYSSRQIFETSYDGSWSRTVFDTNCKTIYHEKSSGYIVDRGVQKMKCLVTGNLTVLEH